MSMKWVNDWTWFERIWLLVFATINLYLFFAWDDSLISLVSSMSGMLCVVLVAKGKISNYYFGIVQAATYSYVAYTYALYGEVMLNALFYLPIQFIGLYMWNKSKIERSESVKGEDIDVKRLTARQWLLLLPTILVVIAAYSYVLSTLRGNTVWIDSTTNVLSITAQILMLKRYAEQWLLWISVNVFSVTMWAIALTTQGGNDYTTLIMWTAFLFNSIYGYYNWVKMAKKQTAVA